MERGMVVERVIIRALMAGVGGDILVLSFGRFVLRL